ncbi:MAG: glycosyl hydrolase family 18 protein [Deltaproteobacteria bacterium]
MNKRITAVMLSLVILTTLLPTLTSADSVTKPDMEVLGFCTNKEGVDYEGKYYSLKDSYQIVNQNSSSMTMASPFWFRLGAEGGGSIEFHKYGFSTKDYKTEAKQIVKNMRAKNIKVLALVHNMLYKQEGVTGKALSHELLTNQKYSDNFINQLEGFMKEYGFDGVNIDIEDVYKSDRNNYTEFINKLKQTLGAKGYMITVSIPAKTFDDWTNSFSYPFDYKGIGKYADRIVIMTYDEHGAWTGSGAGPIASITWQEKVVKYAVDQMPKEKILMGVPVYGFDWAKGKSWPKYSSYEMTMNTAKSKGLQALWNDKYKVPYINYWDGNVQREIWFENASSLSYKINLASKYGLKGIAIWRLGMEDPAVWNVISGNIDVQKINNQKIFDTKKLYTSNDNLIIKLEEQSSKSCTLEIINEHGAKTSQGIDFSTNKSQIISLNNMDDGWYTARIISNDGAEIGSKEFGINCFEDIKNHWARDVIIDLFKQKYVKGSGNEQFKPDNTLTRAEFMVLIARALEIESPTNGYVTKFSDLKNNSHWASSAIIALEEKGYIQGLKNSKGKWYIAPDSKITRAEMAAILSRILVKQGILSSSGTEASFADINGHWAEADIENLQKLNLIKGTENGLFKPDSKTTRAEAAVIIQRYLNLNNVKENPKNQQVNFISL